MSIQIGHSSAVEGSSGAVQSDTQAAAPEGAGGKRRGGGASQNSHEQETQSAQPAAGRHARREASCCEGKQIYHGLVRGRHERRYEGGMGRHHLIGKGSPQSLTISVLRLSYI